MKVFLLSLLPTDDDESGSAQVLNIFFLVFFCYFNFTILFFSNYLFCFFFMCLFVKL
jgi:hypothetical protein